METANEKFLNKFLECLKETEGVPEGFKEAENTPEGRNNDEDIFFRILNARTVGELYGMDISIEDVERIIPRTELLLRKAEGSFWFCRFMTENIQRIQGQKKKKLIF